MRGGTNLKIDVHSYHHRRNAAGSSPCRFLLLNSAEPWRANLQPADYECVEALSGRLLALTIHSHLLRVATAGESICYHITKVLNEAPSENA
jgi:hypothetical protein